MYLCIEQKGFSVYNFERNTDTSIPVAVKCTGNVRFYSPEVRTTFCVMDVKLELQMFSFCFSSLGNIGEQLRIVWLLFRHFPYDTQICSIVVGSWTYTKSMLEVFTNTHKIDMTYYIRNGEWDVYDTGIQLKNMKYSEGTFQELHFTIILQRLFFNLHPVLDQAPYLTGFKSSSPKLTLSWKTVQTLGKLFFYHFCIS